ncbi:MAG: MotA/TolQ/ExbB proton channel family protein [Planctomycetaceae bacterium]|nr:MotA/TolQ/ExbB proton channel family protein [Planctomycetaceae bacterium]
MFQAYWETVLRSPLDGLILFIGLGLVCAHSVGLYWRYNGTSLQFVQGLERYRTFLLLLTEILPVLGLLGTVLSLMNTFKTFQVGSEAKGADLSTMIQAFAPAMSTTISGLIMIAPNLLLNSFLWLAAPTSKERDMSQ